MADGTVGVQQAANPDRLIDNEVVLNDVGQEVYRQKVKVVGLPPNDYLHFQAVPSDLWDIVHGLGFHPGVTVVDTAGTQVEGTVVYIDNNHLQVSFVGSFAGAAFLS